MLRIAPLRNSAALALVLAGSAMLPKALEACTTSFNQYTGVQAITCCGATKCCTTLWKDDVLISMNCG